MNDPREMCGGRLLTELCYRCWKPFPEVKWEAGQVMFCSACAETMGLKVGTYRVKPAPDDLPLKER